jgi:hypothetical protein
MGLLFAKFYIEKMDNQKKSDEHSIYINYNSVIRYLRANEQYKPFGEEFISIKYNGNKIKLTYGDEDSIVFTLKDNFLMFTILKGKIKSKHEISVDYIWLDTFKGIHISVKDEAALIRLMEYRD